MKNIKLFRILLIILLTSLSACGTVAVTSGSTTQGYKDQVKSLGIIAKDDDSFTESSRGPKGLIAIDSLSSMISNVFKTIERRLPYILNLNDVKTREFQYLSTMKKMDPNTRVIHPSHILTIRPLKASGLGRTESEILFDLWLTDMKTNKQVWRGSINFRQSNLFESARSIDDKAADAFSKAILVQLKKDGLLSYPTAEPIMPQ